MAGTVLGTRTSSEPDRQKMCSAGLAKDGPWQQQGGMCHEWMSSNSGGHLGWESGPGAMVP